VNLTFALPVADDSLTTDLFRTHLPNLGQCPRPRFTKELLQYIGEPERM
jgi:hypothetical protein